MEVNNVYYKKNQYDENEYESYDEDNDEEYDEKYDEEYVPNYERGYDSDYNREYIPEIDEDNKSYDQRVANLRYVLNKYTDNEYSENESDVRYEPSGKKIKENLKKQRTIVQHIDANKCR